MTAAATTDLAVRATDAVTEQKPAAVAPSYAQGFDGMAIAPFPDDVKRVLVEPVPDEAVEIKPNGIVYVPGVYYRRQLTRAFGPGGWAIVPRSPARVMGDVVVYPGALYALGRFVAEAVGECFYRQNSQMSYASCVEGAKTDALSRCCKDLGMATELWDKAWRDRWMETYAEKDQKGQWRVRSGRPVQEIDLMAGAGGVAPAAAPKASATSAAAEPASTVAPAAPSSPDTGEALPAEGVKAIRDAAKRIGWKADYARKWLTARFGVANPEALSAQQGANAYALLSLWGKPAYDALLAELAAKGEAKP